MFFVVFGIAGIISLKSSFFPLIDSKFISIDANYPGASPEEIEEGVILKIEENLKGIPGVIRVTSTSRENTGSIIIETDDNYEIDAMLFWNVILTLVVVPFGWAFNKMFGEVKILQILLNKTREEYARYDAVKEDMHYI